MAHILAAVEGRYIYIYLVVSYRCDVLHVFSTKDHRSISSQFVEPWSVCRTRLELLSFAPS